MRRSGGASRGERADVVDDRFRTTKAERLASSATAANYCLILASIDGLAPFVLYMDVLLIEESESNIRLCVGGHQNSAMPCIRTSV